MADKNMISKHTADFEKLMVKKVLSEREIRLSDLSMERIAEDISGWVAYEIHGYFLAGAPKEVSVSIISPTTWWDHLKYDLAKWLSNYKLTKRFSDWLSRRVRTIRRTTKETVNRNVCPHGVVAPKEQHLQFLVHGVDNV